MIPDRVPGAPATHFDDEALPPPCPQLTLPFTGHFPLSPQQGRDRQPAVEGQRAEQAIGHHRADLARAPADLGRHPQPPGRPEEALAITSEAVMLYRGLTDTDPTAYRGLPADTLTALSGILPDLGRLDDTQAARQEADLHGGATRRTVQPALFQLLLFAARQAIEEDLPELAEESRKARGRIVAVIRPYTSSDDDARDLTASSVTPS